MAPAEVETFASAQSKLAELKERYGDNHPRVVEQQRRVTEHTRLLTSKEPEVLRAERVDLAVMRQRYGVADRRTKTAKNRLEQDEQEDLR